MAVYVQLPNPHVPENAQKGYLFEKWVVSRFNTASYQLIEWRSDKSVGKVYPASSLKPDLVLSTKDPAAKVFFAIECKWRSAIKPSGWHWATDNKRYNYQRFAERYDMDVFIIAGVGGQPMSPEQVYIIPFEKISGQNFLTLKQLERYQRVDGKAMLEWDAEKRVLK